jgi:hypothetical protein
MPAPSLQLRNVIEFDGGVTDTYLSSATARADKFNIIWRENVPQFRPAPG